MTDEPKQPEGSAATSNLPSSLLERIATLDKLLERERIQLMQIHAMMKCLNEVLLYSDDDNAVMHADVANVSARLLDQAVARLEVVSSQYKEVATTAVTGRSERTHVEPNQSAPDPK